MPKGKSRSNQSLALGHVYNLRSIFRRLNGLYFDGEVKARLQWGRARGQKSRRSREFGTYYYKERRIRIHPVLDQAWVPLYVVESVLHHEMCHQACPEELRNGRRLAHHAAFRQRERQYVHFYAAEKWMKENLKKLLKAAPLIAMPAKLGKGPRQLDLPFAA